jgi:DNA-binding MarR family transcriptional regulator
MTGPSKDSRRGHRRPTQREVAILDLIAEQAAIPMDQFPRFLGVDSAEATKLVKELEQIGCVEARKLIAGDEPWVWLNSHGARLSDTDFGATEPAVSRLAHTRAINEARLVIAERAPGGRWVCERVLRQIHKHGDKVPDAAILINDERHAIEVELTPKTAARLREIIVEHSARYDAVVYFCSPPALALLKRVKKELNNPKLFVQALPGWSSTPPKPKGRSTAVRQRRGEPRPEDVPVLDLISEQGAIPMDQLARFLDCKLDKAKRVAKRLQEAGLIRRERPLAKESDWIWLSKRGARFSTTGLSAPRPKVGSLALMRAVNEVRIDITKRAPEVGWVSRRALLREQGRNAAVPRAMVEYKDERHAIEVRLAPGLEATLEQLIWQRSADYDAVICFCAPKARRQLERMVKAHHWPKLAIRDLPEVG